jgi:hypothetical protein
MKESSTEIKEVRIIAKNNDDYLIFHTVYSARGDVLFSYRGVNEDITAKEDTADLYLPLKHATRLFYHSEAINNFYLLIGELQQENLFVSYFSSLFLGEDKPNGFF